MSESCSAVCKSTCICARTSDDLDVDIGMNPTEMENNTCMSGKAVWLSAA